MKFIDLLKFRLRGGPGGGLPPWLPGGLVKDRLIEDVVVVNVRRHVFWTRGPGMLLIC